MAFCQNFAIFHIFGVGNKKNRQNHPKHGKSIFLKKIVKIPHFFRHFGAEVKKAHKKAEIYFH